MILSNKHDIERGTPYSFFLDKKSHKSLIDLVDMANLLIAPFGELTDSMSLPSELALLQDISLHLKDRIQSFATIANKLNSNGLLNCEEVTIVDYGCGQGLASLSFLTWLSKNNLIDNVKQVKLIDKDKSSLKRALLHFSIFFPNIDVIAYEQDFLREKFAVECNSILTINIFSHVLGCEFKLFDHIKKLILKGHNLLMHNIILDKESTKIYPSLKSYQYNFNNAKGSPQKNTRDEYTSGLKSYYLRYAIDSIIDHTGCEKLFEGKFSTNKYAVLSRISFEDIDIPQKKDNHFTWLCPGEPTKKLYNVPQRMLWFERPLENTAYCDPLDDFNKISFDKNYISPTFQDRYKKEADELNPKTIKACAEKFHQGHIRHALDCDLPCAHEIVALYEKAAKDGITEAYNNLAILQFQKALDDETAEQKAIELYKLAADGGSDCAMINLASYYMDNDDLESAMNFYKLAADKGNGIALLNLAIISHFGLYGNKVDLAQAEKLYRQCITEFNKEEEHDWRNDSILNICCLNLMLLLNEIGDHYLKILDVYFSDKKPSDTLKYCKEILQITNTYRFSKDILDILQLKETNEKEKLYQKYNRAIFLYYGLNLKSINVKIEKDRDKALEIIKSIAEEKNSTWKDRDKFVFGLYANWAYQNKDNLGNTAELYWREAAASNSKKACASLTNLANFGTITDDEKKAIWRRFAFTDGCYHCHECENYSPKKICPKAQLKWATKYETQEDVRTNLIFQSAAQQYGDALLYLGFRQAIADHVPSFKENIAFNILCKVISYEPPKEYNVLFPILAKDNYYEYLQSSADIEVGISRSIIPFVAEKRGDIYNYMFWSSVFCSKSNNSGLKLKIIEFLQLKCGKSLDNYFSPCTICENQLINIYEDVAKKIDDISLICKLANFFQEGKDYYKAQTYYELAKEKGCKDIDGVLNKINEEISRIEEERQRFYNDSYDDYNPYNNYTWEDSMMDALDGEPDAYWNID